MRIDWRTAAGMAIVGILTTSGVARADTFPSSIAVPRMGTQGVASVYPATLNVVALGGQTQTGEMHVMLHGVTHPCIEDLAILLVHNGTDKYLLLSNAGGCRPLQGTTIHLDPAGGLLPDSEPVSPPHGDFLEVRASNYGSAPVFPAPAPPGPVTTSLPPWTTNINGKWDLYVIDTAADNRGVIQGWSLTYDTEPAFPATAENVGIPGGVGTGQGPAAIYPITFDLTTASEAARVQRVALNLHLNHTLPDNLRMLLQSPSGTSVVLMANAGGGTDLAPGKLLRFVQSALAGPISDAGPISVTTYQPGGAYGGNIALGAPAPQPPYQTSFEAFDGEPARGTWRLWIFDDANANTGQLEDAELTIALEGGSSFDITWPTGNPSTAAQHFMRLEATANDARGRFSYTWRNEVDNVFYDSGLSTWIPGTNKLYADVPVR
jgi:subtilisin-like proprotein convertase family protein